MKDTQLTQMFVELSASVDEIDEQLDSRADGSAAGKVKIGNELVASTENVWTPPAEQLSAALEGFASEDAEKFVGAYLGLTKALKNKFDKQVQEWLTSAVENQPKVESTITDEQAAELGKVRSGIYNKMKMIRDLAVNVDDATEDELVMPKIRRGAVGKRGKRALSLYTWSINGEAVDNDDDSVAGVSKLVGFEKSKDFTAALREAKIDTTNPPETFDWTAADGRVVTATKVSADAEDSEPEDSDSED